MPERIDDYEALFNKRYSEYEDPNPEVVDYFKSKEMLLEVSSFWIVENKVYIELLSDTGVRNLGGYVRFN